MRMFLWIYGKTRHGKIRNDNIKESVGHVVRVPIDFVVRKVDQMDKSQIVKGRGWPRKTIREVTKKDININNLDKIMVLDRTLWPKLIHVETHLVG